MNGSFPDVYVEIWYTVLFLICPNNLSKRSRIFQDPNAKTSQDGTYFLYIAFFYG